MRRVQFEKREIYVLMAEKDKEAAALLHELDSMVGVAKPIEASKPLTYNGDETLPYSE